MGVPFIVPVFNFAPVAGTCICNGIAGNPLPASESRCLFFHVGWFIYASAPAIANPVLGQDFFESCPCSLEACAHLDFYHPVDGHACKYRDVSVWYMQY